jgi:hypothetical protein
MNYTFDQIDQVHKVVGWICWQAKLQIPECPWNAAAFECKNENCRETLDLSTVVYFSTVSCNRAIICPKCLKVCCVDSGGIPPHAMLYAPPTPEEIKAWEEDQEKIRKQKEIWVAERKQEKAQEEERKREVQEWMERVYSLAARHPSYNWENGPPPVLDPPSVTPSP